MHSHEIKDDYSIEVNGDELSIQKKEWLLRSIVGVLGFLLTLIPIGRCLIFANDDGLWMAIVGIAMLWGAVNYSRKLILRRRQFNTERRTSVIWPISSVKGSLEEYSAVVVRKFVILAAR